MKGNIYTLFYAGSLGAVCALLLTAASSFTATYQQADREADIKRNILNVLGVPYSERASSRELVKIFEKNVHQEQLDKLELYRYVPKAGSNKEETVAVEFEGHGLLGPIKGFLALAADMKTIRGITIYEQQETPGLGEEIASAGFCERFKGKKIVDKAGNVGITIKVGADKSAVNEVDAISGATMTCDKVEAILSRLAEKIVQEKRNNGR